MSETPNLSIDQELHQLEVATFEIEDLVEVEQMALSASSCTSTSTSTSSCTSTSSGSTAAMQPLPARDDQEAGNS